MNRNIRLTDSIDVLGDVHLGKKFVNNVPLDFRGKREEMVWTDFADSLLSTTASVHVQVGDLFDAFIVPVEVVIKASDIYANAAKENPGTKYILYSGNHDRSRTEYRKSSYDLFMRLLEPIENVSVLMDVTTIKFGPDSLGFIPWHPFRSADELVQELVDTKGTFTAVFGHWDLEDFGGSVHNLIPLEKLDGITQLVVTGHEHNPREFDHGSCHIIVTGSMQPYSHAEDPTSELYLTLTLEEFNQIQDQDLSSMNLRFLLKKEEVMPDVPALSLTWKRIDAEQDETGLAVEIECFDIKDLLAISLDEAGVLPEFAAKVNEKFGEFRAE